MDEHVARYRVETAGHIIKNLEKRRMEGSYAATAAEAGKSILSMLPDTGVVFRCGSQSMAEMGLWEAIEANDKLELIDPYHPDLAPAESLAERVKGLSADVMLASSNAITLDGRLVNLDGMGNRVAAMAFGPKKVILAVGMNKVAPDLDSALARVKHIAAPINNMRLNMPNPCVKDGLCHDCKGSKRICNIWSVIDYQMITGRIHVVLVGEDLGY